MQRWWSVGRLARAAVAVQVRNRGIASHRDACRSLALQPVQRGTFTRCAFSGGVVPTVSLVYSARQASTDSTVPGAVEEKQFQCSACKKSFRLINALKHHIATRHRGAAKALVVGADGKVVEDAPVDAATAHPTSQAQPATPKAQTAAPPPSQSATPTNASPSSGPSSHTTPTPAPSAAPTTTTTAAAPTPDSLPDGASDGDVDKKLFVCKLCQKAFRLEAALQHHYLAKHNQEAPMPQPAASASSGPAAPSSSAPATSAATPTATAPAEPVASSPSGTQYVHAAESTQPSPPEYRLDVAPNAPSETEIAAHARCVNHILLVGVVQDIQQGFVFDDPVTQFTVSTEFEAPSPGDPDRDFHTVRCFGEYFGKKEGGLELLREGQTVCVSGRLRMVPQFEQASNKFYHFPVVHVQEGAGSVHVL